VHGETVRVGAQTLEVVHLRGHTPGSIALVWRGPEARARTPSPATASPRGVGRPGRRRTSPAWSTTSRSGCSARCRRPGSTPATADTTLGVRHRTSASGAPGLVTDDGSWSDEVTRPSTRPRRPRDPAGAHPAARSGSPAPDRVVPNR
jgi:hypothetical protein